MIFTAVETAVATTKPYVEGHPIGIVWGVVGIATAAIELTGALRRRPEATHQDRGSFLALRFFMLPGVLLLGFAPRILPSAEIRPPLVPIVVGLVIFAAGEALRVWAKVALGRYFTYTVMTSRDQPVITSGPYHYVRHPSYTGLLLMMVGAGAAYGNWVGLAGLVVAGFGGLRYRIYVEEKALMEALGDPYRSYAEHHKRLIPYVW